MPVVFVIVVSYQGRQWYDRCFTSLKQSNIPLHIIVVDNASNDDTVEHLRHHFPDIHLIVSEENVGFGRANNLGIKYALEQGADYFFLLNQDAWIEPDTIRELIRVSQAHPEFGILSPIHLNAKKNHIEKLLLQRLDDYRTTDSALFDDIFFRCLKDVYETHYVNAAAWFLPRNTIEMIGGFDPIFFHYGEDDNYINRVLYHGLKIGICPNLRIVHDNDRARPLYDSREREILMLIDYTNINKNHNLKAEMNQHLLKALKGLIRGRRSASSNHFAVFRWLKKNERALSNSISVNRAKGSSWL